MAGSAISARWVTCLPKAAQQLYTAVTQFLGATVVATVAALPGV